MRSQREIPTLKITTAEDAAYEAIREEVLAHLEPGAPLKLIPLATALGVSTMPVRTALARLESEGMIRQLPRRGAVVAPLEIEDLAEIQALRAGIEGLAARQGAPNLVDADIKKAGRVLEVLRVRAKHGKLSEYVLLSQELHDICYRAVGRARLIARIEEHRRPAERYVRLVTKLSPRFKVSVDHQDRFYKAMVKRDGAGAESALRDALQWTLEQVTEFLS